MRPLIAIPGRRADRVSVLRFSGTIAAEAICEAVWSAGGEPMILHAPAGDPAAELVDRVGRVHGILLPGGADLDPRRYGQDPHPESEPAVEFQDSFDLAIAHQALRAGIPMLAVCRGMQVLNVALGGTLVQHLPPSLVDHREGVHAVEVVPGSRLHKIVDTDSVIVSTYHHQAVDQLGDGLVVTARAADGCVEALEHETFDAVAVQWHPEDVHSTSPTDGALFADLVERARQRREGIR